MTFGKLKTYYLKLYCNTNLKLISEMIYAFLIQNDLDKYQVDLQQLKLRATGLAQR